MLLLPNNDFFIAVDSLPDDNQMVFVDAPDGEESIEVVNSSVETGPSNEPDRRDILEVGIYMKKCISCDLKIVSGFSTAWTLKSCHRDPKLMIISKLIITFIRSL